MTSSALTCSRDRIGAVAGMALMLATVCALTLIAPARASVHPGHDHTVMGTVKSFKDGHVEIEAKDGKVSVFMLTETTKILRGKVKVPSTDIKIGERIVAIGAAPSGTAASSHTEGAHAPTGMLVAKEIRLGATSKVASGQ